MWQTLGIATDILLFISLFFQVFILISLIEKRSLFPKKESAAFVLPDTLPSVSIVVPCYNEESTVAHTIESLLALDYPKELLSIIVVDDGSKDATFARASAYTDDTRVKVFHKENGGKHSAMNFALEKTSSDLIGCLDADSTVASDALKRIVAVFSNAKIAAVTPGIHSQKPTNFLQHLQKAEYRMSIFTRAAFADIGSTFITPGPFSIFRTALIKQVGGWRHAHSTEDLEIGLRLQEIGCIIRNEPLAAVYTKTPSTLRALIRQRIRWTYGFLCNAVDYRHMIGNPTYGNLGLLAIPMALLSIGIALFFSGMLVWNTVVSMAEWIEYVVVTGSFGAFVLDPFFFSTSTLTFLVYVSIIVVLGLIIVGSLLSSKGNRHIPGGTPLFIVFYGFLTPIWLSVAVARATFRTGVRWK